MTTPSDLADRFHQRWLATHPFTATAYGIPGFDDLVPDDSEGGDQALRAEMEAFLREADAVDAAGLAPADRVTLGCLREMARQEMDSIDSAGIEHTVTAMPFSAPASFLALAARTVLVDARAAEDYVARLRRSAGWLDQVSDRLASGATRGRLPVAPLVEQAIGWADQVLAGPAPEPLLAPQAPAGWDGAASWEDRRRAAAADVVKPALARWVDVLREILPAARDGDHPGLCHLPGGDADYHRAIRTHTTLEVTAEELHQIGLDHIAALEQRAAELGGTIGLHGIEQVHQAVRASAGRLDPAEAIRQAVAAIRRAEAAAPEVFPAPLPAPCQVTPMPPIVAAAGTAPHYTPPRLDGGRPGTFWFNTEKPTAGTGWDLEGVAFHEAVPGHHLQLSRLQLLTTLPALQRQRSLTVFSEGWGLYAEQLAEEMGLYSGTQSLLGAISASLMRAARLVVDTGLHAMGWSRGRAVEFFVEHVPMPAGFLADEVDRYIVMPGQALAYLTGKLEILRLRDEARRRLGPAFSLPEFHAAVLDQGSLPLPVLADSISGWMAAR
ncbi:MAG TPA: DUF885 domain-containing protein [Acidimicrobiales bacterium]|nr:DUF885 domain-containing protein [Acidimicrobiales bacterium]